jgi:predicted membrane-bound spermidine synthase
VNPPSLVPPSRWPTLTLAGLAFLLSGAAALVYQVAWQRILALHTGVGIESVAIIVAAFMTGLGLGSVAGGLLSTLLAPRAALLAFAALELAASAYGAGSARLLYDLLYLRASWLYAPAWRGALLHFATLLPPTVLMGMSLPLLARALVSDVHSAARTIALLYGVNVAGASLGALAAPWVFIRHSGVRGALLAAALGNLGAAVAAAVLARDRRLRSAAGEQAAAPTPAPGQAREPLALFAALYALSGFCALSLELLWFRVLEVAVKSTAYTFGTVLSVYLGGVGAGSLVGALHAPRLRRPLRTFLLCQCLILALSGAAMVVLVALPPDTPGFRWYFELWGSRRSFNFGGAWSWPAVLRLYLALPLALFGAPAALMGFSFMALQGAVQDEVRTSGRKVGLLQAANLVGCVAGSLAFGLGALHWLGAMGALRLLLGTGLVFALIGLRRGGGPAPFVGAGAALAVLLVTLPSSRSLWLRLHGLHDPRVLIGEDATGVAAVSPLDDHEGGWRVWVSGRHHSRLPFGGVHTALGAIPALIHPSPAEVAVIGLGSGDTGWAAGCRREATRQVTVYEICAPQLRLLRELAAQPEPPAKLGRFLADPRMRVVVADGRNALERSATFFDVIEMDALFPTSPYSGNLYSVEFYALCARKLRRAGLMCTWAPTARVRASFARAFPHVLEFGDGTLLLGSHDRIPLDLPSWRDRIRRPSVRAYLGDGRAEEVLALLRTARPLTPPAGVEPNHDLFPRDEFNVR